jgi:hypothetical protein
MEQDIKKKIELRLEELNKSIKELDIEKNTTEISVIRNTMRKLKKLYDSILLNEIKYKKSIEGEK